MIPADDFHSKLVAGCHSSEECAALRSEAAARYMACATGPHEPYACDQMARDKNAADDLGHQVAQNDKVVATVAADGVYQQVLDATKAAQAESDRLRSLGSSCEDIAALESAKPTVFPSWNDGLASVREQEDARRLTELHQLAQSRRAERVKALEAEFRTAISVQVALDDADAARRAVQRVSATAAAIVDQMQCYDSDAAAKGRAFLERAAGNLEKRLAQEQACRADATCMTERQLKPVRESLCQALADRKEAVGDQHEALAGIARERSNPSGFVDKELLHDLGGTAQDAAERIHADDVNIASLRGQYAKTAGRPFSPSTCIKEAPAAPTVPASAETGAPVW